MFGSANKPYIGYIGAVVGFALGWFLASKLARVVKALSTAFIGSFCICKGIGTMLGNFPSLENLPTSTGDVQENYTKYGAVFGYLGGIVVLTIAGTVVQLKKFPDENAKDDMFADQDESKKCGCF